MTKGKVFQRFISVGLASAIVVGGVVASAAPLMNVENKVSNDLTLTFNVENVIPTKFIELTWGAGDNSAKEVNTKTNQTESVLVNIDPGTALEDSKVINVLLEIPTTDVEKIASIKLADGTTNATSFEDGDYTYYVLKENVTVTSDSENLSADFNITFDTATDTAIESNIFAIADEAGSEEELSNDTSISFNNDHFIYDPDQFGSDKIAVVDLYHATVSDLRDSLVVSDDADFIIVHFSHTVSESNFDTLTELQDNNYLWKNIGLDSHFAAKVVVKAEDGTIAEYTLVNAPA